MNIQQLIDFLRKSVFIQDNLAENNSEFLALSDGEITDILQIALTKVYPQGNLNNLDNDYIYPVILIAKKELFFRLALTRATEYTICGGDGVKLSKNEIFNHYMDLINNIDNEYTLYLETGIPIQSSDILLDNRYYTVRNYNRTKKPQVNIMLDNIYKDKVEFSWNVSNTNRFHSYNIYLSKKPIYDNYSKEHIKNTAERVDTIFDIHQNTYRIDNLEENTDYYVVVEVKECNGLKGFSEVSFITESSTNEEEGV